MCRGQVNGRARPQRSSTSSLIAVFLDAARKKQVMIAATTDEISNGVTATANRVGPHFPDPPKKIAARRAESVT